MKIGDRVVLGERIELISGMVFEIGHKFTISSDDGIRGFDLIDDNGNRLCETRFIKMKSLSDDRDDKINEILK